MSRPLLVVIAVVGAIVLFLLGVIFSLPKVKTNSTPTPVPVATGKPNLAESIKTPTPMVTPPLANNPGQLPPGQNWGWIWHEGTKVHASAGLDSAVLVTLRYGKRVRVLGAEEGWQQILLDRRKVGFVQAQFVKAERPGDVPADDPAEATKTLTEFFAELNAHRWAAAYDLLSFDFKRSLRYATFETGYSKLESSAYRVNRVRPLSPEKMLFELEILNSESSGTRAFRADFVVVLEQGEWRISQSDQREVPSDSVSPMEALPTVSGSSTPTPSDGAPNTTNSTNSSTNSSNTTGRPHRPFADPTADGESD